MAVTLAPADQPTLDHPALDQPTHDQAPSVQHGVACRTVDSPIGPLLLVATDQGVLRVVFEAEGHDEVLAGLRHRLDPDVRPGAAHLDPLARQLNEYFAGERTGFTVPLDLRLVSGFRSKVLDELRRIEPGSTATYAQVAAATGSPGAVRAVGSACAGNPLPLLVPCHRVVRSDGTTGQYLGGTEAKRLLLDLERRGT